MLIIELLIVALLGVTHGNSGTTHKNTEEALKHVEELKEDHFKNTEEALKYVEEFKEDYFKYTGSTLQVHSSILFLPQLEQLRYMATCSRIKGKYNHIEISERSWNKLTPYQRKLLIYHELGHCELKSDHSREYTSIMRTDFPANPSREVPWGSLLEDLFSPKKPRDKLIEYE